jgi:predicted metal-dependent peptidase
MDWERSTTDICLYSPFMARALLSLPMTEDNSIETMATDGYKILFNREWTEKLSPQECDGVRVHECLHVLLGHHVRQGSRDHAKWNVACDGEINAYVEDSGYTLPADAIRFPQWAGKTAEEIYDLLPPSPQMPAWGIVTPGAEPGTAEHQQMVDEWHKQMAGTSWGNLPENIARAINQQLTPKPDLAAHVAAWLRSSMPGDAETWAPPSRRNSLLPSEDNQPSGHVVACVDSSGSIDNEELIRFLSNVAGLADVGRLDIVIGGCQVDSYFEDVDLDDIKDIAGKAHDGGGTDFRPLLEHAARLGPDAIVYVTDGYGEFGPALYVPTLWAMSTDVVAPWGDTMRLKA